MADVTSYNMGQVRYKSSYNYITKIEDLQIASMNIFGSYLDTVFFRPNQTFRYGDVYYLKLSIPRNFAYDLIFDLKLLQVNSTATKEEIEFSEEAKSNYQEIKRFSISKQVLSSAAYSRVVLYQNPLSSEEEVKIAIVEEDPLKINKLKDGAVYYLSSNGTYFIHNSTEADTEISNKNDSILVHTWKQDSSQEKVDLNFIITNKVSTMEFNVMALELVRNSYDEDIQYEIENDDGTKTKYRGIYINPEKIDYEFYSVSNLLNNNKVISPSILKSIGVWARPDMLMVINKEEIRVGQSGYYELNDFDITFLGMISKDSNDRFLIDYQYKSD